MDSAAPSSLNWSARVYPVMRGLVAVASLSIDGRLRTGPPRPRAALQAIAVYEQANRVRLDDGHRRFLLHANDWPSLWPIGVFGLPELGNRHRIAALIAALAATGDLAAEHLELEEVYPVAWAREGGTAVAVRPGRERAGEVLWFEGIRTSRYAGFTEFFDAVADRLLMVCGTLAGGTVEGREPTSSSASRARG